LCNGPIRPHCRTQTFGATSFTTLSNASRINEIGQATKGGNELLQLAQDFDIHHFALEPMQKGVPDCLSI
jgi:hypothetical protein